MTADVRSPAEVASSTARLAALFEACGAEHRAALVGYLPAGYPTVEGSRALLRAMLDGGCDLVEVGVPYSDPVLDGPTIQAAAETALRGGVRLKDVLAVVESIAAAGGRAVVMTYWNPVHRYGVDAFARDLAAAGGLGVITPDLIPDEAHHWRHSHRQDCQAHDQEKPPALALPLRGVEVLAQPVLHLCR